MDGENVRIAPDTKIERPNQKDITARDLHIGWEVEVDARQEGSAWVARQVKVKDARFKEDPVRGIIDDVKPKAFFVDGDEVRLAKGEAPPPGLKPGMRFEGKGIRLDDRSIELKEGKVFPAGFEVWRVFSRYVKDQSKAENWFFSDHSTQEARIKNLTKAINADYRGTVSRTNLRVGEEEHQQAVARLAQQNAMANLQKKEYAQAARSLQAAVSRHPQDAVAQYNLGRVLWAQGGAQNAQPVLEHFVAAVQADPNMAAPWRDIGVVFYELRDMNRCALAFENYLSRPRRPGRTEDPRVPGDAEGAVRSDALTKHRSGPGTLRAASGRLRARR